MPFDEALYESVRNKIIKCNGFVYGAKSFLEIELKTCSFKGKSDPRPECSGMFQFSTLRTCDEFACAFKNLEEKNDNYLTSLANRRWHGKELTNEILRGIDKGVSFAFADVEYKIYWAIAMTSIEECNDLNIILTKYKEILIKDLSERRLSVEKIKELAIETKAICKKTRGY